MNQQKGKGIFALIPETEKEVDLTDASRLNDNTLYKFFRDENAALKQRIKELEREVISLRKNNSTHY